MNEYIEKAEVIKKLCLETAEWYCSPTIKTIKEFPAADVQPVKHGRWIGIIEYCKKNGYIPSGMGIYYWCSECGKEEPKISDYCPNCGARMDGDTK